MARRSPESRGSRWSQLTVRTRLVIVLVLLALLAVAVSGVFSFGLQRAAIHQRIDDTLNRAVSEAQTLAETGTDPDTGQPFNDSSELVYTVMTQHSPGAHEAAIGLGAGSVTWLASPNVSLRLEDDQQLMDELLPDSQAQNFPERVNLRTINTDTTEYRLAQIPVQYPGETNPTMLVYAVDVRAEMQQLESTYLTYALTGLGVVVAVALIGYGLVGRLLFPLRKLQSTASAVTDESFDRRVEVTGHDDVAELAHTFNAMLDRLQTSFNAQKQLLDDVGHEMRTPITIVQGNLELLDPHDPDDVEQVRGISLDELERTNRLLEDLMTLAKAGRPEFVRPEPVDVTELTHEVKDKATHLGDRKWSVAEAAGIVVQADAQRITQAWLQLAHNAVKYSEAGTHVELGSSVVEGPVQGHQGSHHLTLWVRDEGVGIAAAELSKIFERFGRGSNSTRAEGSGLGLNIVTEIVRAHGGTVSINSRPGVGSTVIMHFPLPSSHDPHGV